MTSRAGAVKARLTIAAVALAGCFGIHAAPALADNTGLGELLHALSKERGRTCFADHFHYWTGDSKPNKKAAIDAAVGGWRGFTAAEYGSDWANFNVAGSKKISCSQGSGGISCSVEARPCKS